MATAPAEPSRTHEYPELPRELVPLHPDANPEEKDRHWYETCCMGDRMPQLTLRAVLMGAGLGMLMPILENNCMQFTASAAGYSTGSTIATAAALPGPDR